MRKGRVPNCLILILIAGLILSPGLAAADASTTYMGLSLSEALSELRARGLEIFFTNNLVRPEMRVVAEPTATALRDILEELLAPHGLAAAAGPGGRLVVVAAAAKPSGVRGLVRERYRASPIPGVSILVPGALDQTISSQDGSFLLDLPAGSYTLEARLPGFVVGRTAVTVKAGQQVEVVFELESAPVALDEILVTPSSISLMREEPVSGLDLDRNDIFALPHFGDDIFRAFTLLPGITGQEASARFNVRGGRTDEVLVLLDRVELFEPYHLKDYSSRVSIVTPRALREVNPITGGFPAQYGDRMSGVLDMSTLEPDDRRLYLGLSILGSEVGGSGSFRQQRGHWLASLRRSHLDLALDLLDIREDPRYWDAFAKAEYRPRPEQRFGIHMLHSDDALDFSNVDVGDDTEDYLTDYANTYLWLTHQAILGSHLFVDSTASFGRIERDRRGVETVLEPGAENEGFSLIDKRRLDIAGFKQDWSLQAGDDHYVRWGLAIRSLETDYDYFNSRELDDPLAGFRAQPRTGTTFFEARLRGEQYSFYLSDRLRPAKDLTVELGLRYDEQTLTADRDLSPRINLVYALGRASTLRVAWGYFFQSQRPYELQVEDGITELTSAERTEQRVLGFEHAFAMGGTASDLLLRVEAYQRKIDNPRPRYENIYEPVSVFPEIELDRVLIAPEKSEAYGLEFFLRGSAGRLDWWTSYTWSRIDDRIDGRDVPRSVDQTHAFTIDLNYRAGKHWNINLAWRYHTGWPTTPISGRLEEGDDEDGEDDGDGDGDGDGKEDELEIVPVVGPLNSERLSSYHRLDLRASREWKKKRGTLGFFLEIQNVYNRRNIAGFDIDDFQFELRPDGEIDVIPVAEEWDGFLPSFGITWEF